MNKILRLVIVIFAGLGLVGVFILALPTSAARDASTEANIVVDTLEDELNNDEDCSLREAINAANNNISIGACPSGDGVLTDTITFDIAGTIMLTEQLSVTIGGPMVIDGGNTIAVSGNESVRVLYVESSADLKLINITIRDGYEYQGGGIWNGGVLDITNCTFINNGQSEPFYPGGGGIANIGTLTITNSNFDGNWAMGGGAIFNPSGMVYITHSSLLNNIGGEFGGGAITNGSTGTLWIVDSTLAGNKTYAYGGGIDNHGTAYITNSTISDNIVDVGDLAGGIYNGGTLYITNSTIANNKTNDPYSLLYGGGIYNYGVYGGGDAYISNSTITGNSAENGGGIYNDSGTVTLYNTIIAENINGGNCSGVITDGGHNIDDVDTCGFSSANDSMSNTDPYLGPLQDNGGPSWTCALLPNSPAIDAADPAGCPSTDQRGVQRPFDGDGDGLATCDIGSYELAYVIAMDPASLSSSAAPGATVRYSLDLYNLSGMTDLYTLTLGSHSWETVPSTEMIGPIPNGESQRFSVTVTIPLTPTWYMTDTVTIYATSITSPTVYSTTAWITTQAQIDVSPPALTHTQYVDQIVTLPLTISNGFEVPLSFTIMPLEGSSWINLEPDSGSVNPNSTTQVLVSLDATGLLPDVYMETLNLEINDPDMRSIQIPVTMTVVAQPKIFLPMISRWFCPDFFDDFSNSISGWDEDDDEFVRSEYINGEFRIFTKQSGYYYLYTAPTCARENYIVEVDARWVGTPGRSYGLIFGVDEDFNYFYLFDVNTDYMEFRLLRSDPGGWYVIVPVTFSSAINSGNESNHLKIIRDGDQIILEANGVVLGTWYDSSITGSTYVGIVSSPYTNYPTSDARFDNFSWIGLPSGFGLVQEEGGSIISNHCSNKPNESHIFTPATDQWWISLDDEDR